jgi:hypothetical protein
MLVEVDERTVLLLLGRRRWQATGHRYGLWVKGRLVGRRIVKVGLEPANHCRDVLGYGEGSVWSPDHDRQVRK